MLLTATGGSWKQEDAVDKIKEIFPAGKAPATFDKKKEVFVTAGMMNDDDEEKGQSTIAEVEEAGAVLEALLGEESSEYASSEVAEAFETYKDIRKSVRAAKMARGFKDVRGRSKERTGDSGPRLRTPSLP